MIAPPQERLAAILQRHDIVMATLNAGPEPEQFVALSRELSELDPVVAAVATVQLLLTLVVIIVGLRLVGEEAIVAD